MTKRTRRNHAPAFKAKVVDGMVTDHLADRLFTTERLKAILAAYIAQSADAQIIRQAMAKPDQAFRKAYLRLFVETVTVGDSEIAAGQSSYS